MTCCFSLPFLRQVVPQKGENTMDEIVNLFVNNGTAIAVIIYFMYRDFHFMNNLTTTLTTLVDTVDVLKDLVKDFKESEKKTNDD